MARAHLSSESEVARRANFGPGLPPRSCQPVPQGRSATALEPRNSAARGCSCWVAKCNGTPWHGGRFEAGGVRDEHGEGSLRKLPSGRCQARYLGPDGRTYSARTEDDKSLKSLEYLDNLSAPKVIAREIVEDPPRPAKSSWP